MLDSIYHMTLNLLTNRIFWLNHQASRNVIMDAITLRHLI